MAVKSDEDRIRSLEAKNEEQYENIGIDRLVLFAVSVLEDMDIEPTFDKVVVAIYKLFPDRFSLIGFPEYPDGKRIHDGLFRCTYKNKKWLSGNAKSGYKITDKGTYFLREAKKMLSGEIGDKEKKIESTPKRKEFTFIKYLKDSEAFNKFQNENVEGVTEREILDSIKVPNKKKNKIGKNLKRFLDYARRIEDEEAEEFLLFVREELDYSFEGKEKDE